MAHDVMLSTVDNPYDPFTEYDKWYVFDTAKGYDTCGLLARLAQTSSEFTEEKQLQEIEQAIDDFLLIDPIGLYVKKVKK